MAFTVLNGIYPDQATPELMELTARVGSMLPYRKTAELLAEFLPIKAAEGHVTVRKRTLTVGARLATRTQHAGRSTGGIRRQHRYDPCAMRRSKGGAQFRNLRSPLRTRRSWVAARPSFHHHRHLAV